MIISDGKEEEGIVLDESDPSDSSQDPDPKKIPNDPLNQGEPLTQNDSQKTIDEKSESKVTCRFYATNSCKFKSKCRFEHPKFCPNFKKMGLRSSIQKGVM